ncbi:MAG: hypothetical protein QM697_00215 [Lachnospiraceae bacterium]
MKRKMAVLVCALSLAAFGLVGCGKGTDTTGNDDVITDDTAAQDEAGLGADDTEVTDDTADNTTEEANDNTAAGTGTEGKVLEGYNTMLQSAGSQEDIYKYIDENISSATPEEADQMITGLIGHTGKATSLDYTKLEAHKGYLSEEMGKFIDLMKQEQEKPSTATEEGKKLSVTELLNRASDFEKQMNDYPEGATNQYAYEMYEQIMNSAITGGYDATNKTANSYLDNGKTLGESYRKEYTDFAGGEYKGTKTAGIVSDYVGMFDEGGTVNDKITAYYENFKTNLKDAFTGTNTTAAQ